MPLISCNWNFFPCRPVGGRPDTIKLSGRQLASNRGVAYVNAAVPQVKISYGLCCYGRLDSPGARRFYGTVRGSSDPPVATSADECSDHAAVWSWRPVGMSMNDGNFHRTSNFHHTSALTFYLHLLSKLSSATKFRSNAPSTIHLYGHQEPHTSYDQLHVSPHIHDASYTASLEPRTELAPRIEYQPEFNISRFVHQLQAYREIILDKHQLPRGS